MVEKINSETLQVTSFDIIFHNGNARTLMHETFCSMCKEMFEEVEEKLRQANEEILHARQLQTQLPKEYVNGTKIGIEIIMVHAQDHLITTMTLLEIAQEMNYLYQKNKWKGRFIVQDTVKKRNELEKEQLSSKNIYSNRYLFVRYPTAFFFFMNMQQVILLLSAKSLGSSLLMVLLLAILPAVGEQIKLYRKHQTNAPWTKRYFLFQGICDILLISVLFTSRFTLLYPFMTSNNRGRLFVFILIVSGIFVSIFIQCRLKRIPPN